MKEKYLLFQNDADDANIYPLKNLQSIEAGNATLTFTFDTVAGDDTIAVTCGTDEHKTMIDLATFLGSLHTTNDGIHVIADDVNGVYATGTDISACGAAS
jgi:hypothetical protein